METGSVDFDLESRVKALVEEVLKGQKAASGGATLGGSSSTREESGHGTSGDSGSSWVLAVLLQLVCE